MGHAAPSPSGARARALLAAFLAAAVLGPGCRDPVTRTECNALLDRYVELLAHTNGKDTSAPAIEDLQRQARDLAATDPAFADCEREVSRRQLECALAAPTADRLEICLM